jgi:hypothetical protein
VRRDELPVHAEIAVAVAVACAGPKPASAVWLRGDKPLKARFEVFGLGGVKQSVPLSSVFDEGRLRTMRSHVNAKCVVFLEIFKGGAKCLFCIKNALRLRQRQSDAWEKNKMKILIFAITALFFLEAAPPVFAQSGKTCTSTCSGPPGQRTCTRTCY